MNEQGPLESVERMRAMAYDLLDTAETLEREYGSTEQPAHPRALQDGRMVSNERLAQFATVVYDQRRKRDALLGAQWFGEPVWDILLDLFVRRAQGVGTPVGSACIASCVPHTTALRYITMLVDEGLITSSSMREDRRARVLQLSDDGYAKMSKLLAQMYLPMARRKNHPWMRTLSQVALPPDPLIDERYRRTGS